MGKSMNLLPFQNSIINNAVVNKHKQLGDNTLMLQHCWLYCIMNVDILGHGRSWLWNGYLNVMPWFMLGIQMWLVCSPKPTDQPWYNGPGMTALYHVWFRDGCGKCPYYIQYVVHNQFGMAYTGCITAKYV